MKQIYYTEGLTCGSCAMKIQADLQKLPDVSTAFVDLTTQRIILESSSAVAFERVLQIVKDREPEVKVSVEKNKDSVARLPYRLIISLVLFGAGFLLPEGIWRSGLYLLGYLIAGYDVVFLAVRNIIKGQIFDENFLMSLATIGAILLGDYGEGAAVMIFYQFGEYFQDRAVDRSRKSIQSMMELRIETVHVKRGLNTIDVRPEEVAVGELMVIKPGERIGLDALVRSGVSSLQTMTVTGESRPLDVGPGSEIMSGSVNLSSTLEAKVLRTHRESTVTKIMDLVENASSRKAQTELFITKFSKIYTPAVVGIALLLAVSGPLLFSLELTESIHRALIFLVISCPCALVLSIPLSYFAGLGASSRHGLVLKGANYLEALSIIDTVVLDKTGTVTEGVFEVNRVSDPKALEYAAIIEQGSNHPIAKSIVKSYPGELPPAGSVTDYPGEGLVSESLGISAGNGKLMKRLQIPVEVPKAPGTVIYVARDGQFVGWILIGDRIKKDSRLAISSLLKNGIKDIVLLTGDHLNEARRVASELSISTVRADLLPQDKLQALEDIKAKGAKTLFAGDGTNDSPVLALADVGIAMGDLATDAAMEAADGMAMNGSLLSIAAGIRVAKATKDIVKQNIVFILAVKLLIMLLGAFGFAGMWAAVFADVGVALLTVLNALRLLRL